MTDEQSKRGFARLTPEQRKEVSRKGGLASQESGRAHRFTSEEGKAAGRKGGQRHAEKMRSRDVAG